VFKASPRDVSGSHARRSEEAAFVRAVVEEEDVGRESGAGFCWRRAM
jgi:hypothetical protein